MYMYVYMYMYMYIYIVLLVCMHYMHIANSSGGEDICPPGVRGGKVLQGGPTLNYGPRLGYYMAVSIIGLLWVLFWVLIIRALSFGLC